jgi:UDP-N-acetyl-D-mannosaminuronic acid dehydrogenase
LQLIPLAREINDAMPAHMLALIEDGLAEAGRELEGARVALLGVAYLENADDTRNTPAAALAHLLLDRGADVVAHDPHVREPDWHRALGSPSSPLHSPSSVPLTKDLEVALADADCAAIVTGHRDYRNLTPDRLLRIMSSPVLVDGRNTIAAPDGAADGLILRALGKPAQWGTSDQRADTPD